MLKLLILLVLSDFSWSCEFEVILLIGHWQYVLFDELRKLDSLLGIYLKKLQLNLLLSGICEKIITRTTRGRTYMIQLSRSEPT